MNQNFDNFDEKKLVKEAQNNDQEAIVALYNRHVQEIYYFLLKRAISREEAEDLTSQTFLKMMSAIKNFEGRSSFRSWLFSIAKNTLMDSWRKHYKVKTVALEEYLEFKVTYSDITYDDSRSKKYMDKLKPVLHQLPENYQQVINCRFFESLSLKETAQKMGKSVSNVKVLQYRAIKKATEIAKQIT